MTYDQWKLRSDRDEYDGGFEPPVEDDPSWHGQKIVTTCQWPPIGTRAFDWVATLDNYEPSDPDGETGLRSNDGQPVGYGATEAEAIADLRTQLEDDGEGEGLT